MIAPTSLAKNKNIQSYYHKFCFFEYQKCQMLKLLADPDLPLNIFFLIAANFSSTRGVFCRASAKGVASTARGVSVTKDGVEILDGSDISEFVLSAEFGLDMLTTSSKDL